MKRLSLLAVAVAFSLLPRLSAGEEPVVLEEVVVTGTREAEPLKETPSTVNSVSEKQVEKVKPTHPSEVMNRVPGVWINSTGGEGHITSIRQPLTTAPVYLFLEDGVPIRSTGFFNHNALYEVNLPAASKIELIKGTGTALYGSDAIGGTINVMTRPAPLTPEVEINPEIGSYDWYRLLLSAGNTWGDDGLRLDVNTTHSGGWRERKEYDRYSTTLRWDHVLSAESSTKTILSYSLIDQETSGGAPLNKDDYDTRPWYNYHTFDYRKVEALRLSTNYEKEFGTNLVSLIPFFRWNRMELLPEWGIFSIGGGNYRGYESATQFWSAGLLAKYRKDFSPMRARVIAGVDLDYSPGEYDERRLIVTRDPVTLKYTSFTYDASTANNYDYEATFFGASPYAQVEVSPVERLRFTLGARYDALGYDYNNNLSTSANRPASTEKHYYHLSPKAGVTCAFTDAVSGFLSYNHGFRIPSPGDLFRASGTATTSVELDPIKVDSFEAGVRGELFKRVSFSTSVYFMEKKDDIVTFNQAPGDTRRLNAGETEHKGVEVGAGVRPVEDVLLDVSYSYAKHTYVDWKVSPTVDLSGKEMAIAPRQNLNVSLEYSPAVLKGGSLEVEWAHLGSYWMDDANTEKYDGHDLINLRASYNLTQDLEVYVKALNLFDRKYADRATKSSSGERLFAPGSPETYFAGFTYRWRI